MNKRTIIKTQKTIYGTVLNWRTIEGVLYFTIQCDRTGKNYKVRDEQSILKDYQDGRIIGIEFYCYADALNTDIVIGETLLREQLKYNPTKFTMDDLDDLIDSCKGLYGNLPDNFIDKLRNRD